MEETWDMKRSREFVEKTRKEDSDKFFYQFMIWVNILIYPAILLLWSWTLAVMWRWFIVPIFPVPTLTVIQAAGVALTVAFITGYVSLQEDVLREKWSYEEKAKYQVRALVYKLLRPLLLLVVAWFLHWYV